MVMVHVGKIVCFECWKGWIQSNTYTGYVGELENRTIPNSNVYDCNIILRDNPISINKSRILCKRYWKEIEWTMEKERIITFSLCLIKYLVWRYGSDINNASHHIGELRMVGIIPGQKR